MDMQYRMLPTEINVLGEDQVRIRMTTPGRARDGHILPTEACVIDEFLRNPILLWRHDSGEPIGTNSEIKVTRDGIDSLVTFAPLGVSATADRIRGLVKAGIVRSVSIGFKILDAEPIDKSRPYDGLRAKKWELHECSFVSIPSDTGAVVTARELDGGTIDAGVRATTRNTPPASANPPGATGQINQNPERRKPVAQTIAEQIASYEAQFVARSTRMDAIMDGAAERGETLSVDETEEYDTCRAERKSVEEHLTRLRERDEDNRRRAVPVQGADAAVASVARGAPPVYPTVRQAPVKLAPGLGFTRFVLALTRAQGNIMLAERIAASNPQWRAESPDVELSLRAAVEAGTTTATTWASPLVQYENLASEFIEYLRPMTIIGRINGMRRVPFKVKIPRQTGAATVNWVGEGKAKPISALAFDSITLDHAKIAGIVVLTDELVRLSNPAAEMLVRDDLAAGIVQFMDNEFVDPTNASTDVSPASITYGVTPVVATGTSASALRADIKTLMATFLDSNLSVADAVWIMTQQTALALSLMTNSLGQPEFPGLTMNGGTLLGLPVVTSENVPATGGSPVDGFPIILAKASDILLADDGQVTIDASREASLQMDSAPDSPPTASTTLVSMFQHNMVAIRAERMVNWKLRRAEAVGYISSARYTD